MREVSPAVDAKTSTVRIKVAIESPPAALTLGSAVAGTAKSHSSAQITLPWTALTASGTQPAVWIVDSATNTVLVRPVAVGGFEAGTVVVRSGLEVGDRIIVDGGKLLSRGQAVTYDTGDSR